MLGRHAQPQVAEYSAVCAVQNLWLAARAEGLGVGWVSFFDERELAAALGLPEHVKVVAYLCVGHVAEFPPAPELVMSGWARQRPLAWAVHEGRGGSAACPARNPPACWPTRSPPSARRTARRPTPRADARPSSPSRPARSATSRTSPCGWPRCGECPPPMPEPAAVAVFAGDHGVHAQGVTPWPQEVTAQMVANFLASTAVVNVIAAQAGAEVCVVDVGVAADLPAAPGCCPARCATAPPT